MSSNNFPASFRRRSQGRIARLILPVPLQNIMATKASLSSISLVFGLLRRLFCRTPKHT
jgi:hypothetical protein